MSKLPEMIDYFRKEKQLTLEEVGNSLGKSKSAISRWIKGDRSPTLEDIEKIAVFFKTDISTLIYGQKKMKKNEITVSKNTALLIKLLKQLNEAEKLELVHYANELIEQRKTVLRFPVKVTEALAAGIGYSYGNNEVTTYYTNRNDLKPYDIASAIVGDSMEPNFSNGDIALIKSNMDLISGDIYAVDYAEKSYIKKVYFEKEHLRLVSLNEKYDDIIIPRHSEHYLNIVGRVVDSFTPVP